MNCFRRRAKIAVEAKERMGEVRGKKAFSEKSES